MFWKEDFVHLLNSGGKITSKMGRETMGAITKVGDNRVADVRDL